MIIGVTGPICSGTDTFPRLLVEYYGFIFKSCSGMLESIAQERGKERNREYFQGLGDELRKGDSAAICRLLMKDYSSGTNYVVSNLRNPGEVEYLNGLGNFRLVLVYAPVKTRFDRLLGRGRDPDEPKTIEDFLGRASARTLPCFSSE
ncbi:MAG TPA: AAA family ATPase [Candidatus Nanoarchaeia archaeon]|nr:AAA family ATPase [Candidatus Nanoarchaeia archaeon]